MSGCSVSSVLDKLSQKRVIYVGGKGGVGKTTCSVSLAIALAKRCQKKVLLISTDPAHNLSDALGQQLSGAEAQAVEGVEGLWAVETDPKHSVKSLFAGMETGEGRQPNSLGDQVSQMVGEMRDWLSGVPGIDEAVALMQLLDTGDESNDKYDCIVLDTAPTGHTLKLLRLPAILEIGIARLESWKMKLGNLISMASMFLSSGSANEVPMNQRVADKLRALKEHVERLKAMFTNKDTTTFVCVGIPESLSVMETKRLISSLDESNIDNQLLIVNRMFNERFLGDEDGGEPASKKQKTGTISETDKTKSELALDLCKGIAKIHQKYFKEYHETYGKSHDIIRIDQVAHEPTGVEQLHLFIEAWVHV